MNKLISKKSKINFFSLFLILLIQGCGTSFNTRTPNASGLVIENPNNVQPVAIPTEVLDGRSEYNSLPTSTEGSLAYYDHFGQMLLGANILERNSYSGDVRVEFCRRYSAVVPNPVYTYRCYTQVSSGDQASEKFLTLPNNASTYLVGSTYGGTYSSISERSSTDQKTICQTYTTGGTSYSYGCFQQR